MPERQAPREYRLVRLVKLISPVKKVKLEIPVNIVSLVKLLKLVILVKLWALKLSGEIDWRVFCLLSSTTFYPSSLVSTWYTFYP